MNVVILSPHRDDAAFSCGLLMRGLLNHGAGVTIINVCTVSDYAPYLAVNETDRIQQVTAARAIEDELFIAMLAADAHIDANTIGSINLQWQDAPLRWNMEHEGAVQLGATRPQEVSELSRRLAALQPNDLVLAPQAIGGHVDHILVREAALQTFDPGNILLYEDLPYACETSAKSSAVSFTSCERWLPAALWPGKTKYRYATCYSSQIELSVAEKMEQYAATLGGTECFFGTPEAIQKVQAASTKHGIAA